MAELAVFSLASKILSTIASPAFKKAYEKGLFIWEARDELKKLQVTIETIQVVLLDAEKKQQDSAPVKNWIKRLKGVLYDAEDVIDEAATDDLLKQQMMEGKNKLSLKNKVRVSFSNFNSRNSIAKKVEAIRKSLHDISTDMAQFEFVRCQHGKPMFDLRRGQDPGCFVDTKAVIGRDEDKKTILKMLLNEWDIAKPNVLVVIAILGIGGMGKTTLAQLIYNSDEVKNKFENRWFVCISNTFDEREVLGKIFQSICEGSYSDLNIGQLQTNIMESIKGKKYLLVLDDVWEDHRGRWKDRMSLLSGGAKESMVIVTTRLPSVVDVVGALRTHNLESLSENDSWDLFEKLAFDEEYEKDPRRESLGKEILKRCRGVPLAIRSMGSLLYKKTILEWEVIGREALSTLGRNYDDETMSVLKLSYDHLPSNLKQCFAYCCLFPKDYRFDKQKLIYLWTAQGYTDSDNEESDFMHLLRRGFFQEAKKDDCDEIKSCKMHDIMHDLALIVSAEDNIVLSVTSPDTSSCTRHVSLVVDSERDIPASLFNVKRLRSCLLSSCTSRDTICDQVVDLDQFFANFKLLRTLTLSGLGIKKIPESIGQLKLIRYLDLSCNDFVKLPDSITNLVNLFALNLWWCSRLELLPKKFHKLINLRYLNIEECKGLKVMPLGLGELARLQYLSDFKVGKKSGPDPLAGLPQQLRGGLSIKFYSGIEECSLQLPVSLQQLKIKSYRGIRITDWGNIGRANNLARLQLYGCQKVNYLPCLRCLPNLRWLLLKKLNALEFMDEEENEDKRDDSIFFPRLENLELYSLPQLRGWWRKVAAEATSLSTSCASTPLPAPHFPFLSRLSIEYCPKLELKSFPLCQHLRGLRLNRVDCFQEIQQQSLPTVFCSSTSSPLEDIMISECPWLWGLQGKALKSLRCLEIDNCPNLKSLYLASPQLQTIEIYFCTGLSSVDVEAPTPSLSSFQIYYCYELENLRIVHPTVLAELRIYACPELELSTGVNWDSLPNLRLLRLNHLDENELPHSVVHRQALGQLQIRESTLNYSSNDEDNCSSDDEDNCSSDDEIWSITPAIANCF